MLTVACVLRSGGEYDAEWVRKLRDGVQRHLSVDHRFVCFSDTDVCCDRIQLEHLWPGWWSKIEIFRTPFTGPVLYFDLDTVIVRSIDDLADMPYKFAMLRGFGRKHYIGSGIMWIREPMRFVYERFMESPERFMLKYESNPTNMHNARNAHRGDQAFIYDTVGDENISRFTDDVPGLVRLYPKHFMAKLPEDCAVVCFKGKVKPPDAMQHSWCQREWA